MNAKEIILGLSSIASTLIFAQDKNEETIFNKNYKLYMISRGDNKPDFDSKKDSVDYFLINLHQNKTLKDFQNETKFSAERIDTIINFLKNKNWLHEINRKYKPTIFVADIKDGEKLYQYSKPISKEIAKAIEKELLSIKNKFSKTEIAKTQTFEEWSFLILSDVLLDAWQINNVEKKFLKVENRPLRHGKNYYAALQEIKGNSEPFNIYGNQVGEICVYGNNRNNADISATNYFISKTDNVIFEEISAEFLPKLLKVLESKRQYAEKIYQKSGYSQEISFEEFYIWWYHFIYSQATEIMQTKKIIRIPTSHNFVYKINF